MRPRDPQHAPTWRREALKLLTYEPASDAADAFETAATLADGARLGAAAASPTTASRCVPSDEATGIAVPRPRRLVPARGGPPRR